MAANRGDYYIEISATDELRLQVVKAVLTYEAAVRGLTQGQAFLELLREASDAKSYPPEVREELDAIAEGGRRRAVERALAASRMQRSA